MKQLTVGGTKPTHTSNTKYSSSLYLRDRPYHMRNTHVYNWFLKVDITHTWNQWTMDEYICKSLQKGVAIGGSIQVRDR